MSGVVVSQQAPPGWFTSTMPENVPGAPAGSPFGVTTWLRTGAP